MSYAKRKEHKLNDIDRVSRYFEFCYSMRMIIDLIFAQGHQGAILSAYETIMTDRDTDTIIDNYETYYMTYGLFRILIKWAKSGYDKTPQELAEIVVNIIFDRD